MPRDHGHHKASSGSSGELTSLECLSPASALSSTGHLAPDLECSSASGANRLGGIPGSNEEGTSHGHSSLYKVSVTYSGLFSGTAC